MTVSVASVARAVDVALPGRRRRVRRRLRVLAEAVSGSAPSSTRDLVAWLAEYVGVPSGERLWLVLAVLRAELPLAEDVVDAVRVARLEGGLAAVAPWLTRSRWVPTLARREVRVVSDVVLVDVDHTSTVKFATGIQRVVRETVKRWVRDHDPLLVGWTADHTALRPLTDAQRHTTLTGEWDVAAPPSRWSRLVASDVETVVIPLGGRYIIPELTLDRSITLRLAAMAEFSSTSTSTVGFDAVPLSSAGTTDYLVSGGFANNLSAVKHFDRVATISDAARDEYRGWRSMLTSVGLPGPEVETVSLPFERTALPVGATDALEGLSDPAAGPLVVCVGSHEPRKNHLAVLQSAEVLWREGLAFQLLFVGGNAWASGYFAAAVAELRNHGRAVETVEALTDELLWEAYREARFTVFPSLNEGFGLPIAESLSAGTPVVTSGYGSMAAIADGRGGVLVDPRDDRSVADGMRRLLTDDALVVELEAQTRLLPVRDWDDYARELWAYFSGD